MGELIVVTGPPGAGKSTISAAVVERRNPSALIEGDAFFGFLRRGRVDPWLPAANDQNTSVTEAAAAATAQFVRAGYVTVYDGIVGPWFLPTFAAAAGLEDFHYVILLPTLDESVRRVQHRVGHGFSDEAATRHMHDQFARAQIDGRHVLHGRSGSPDEIADEIVDLVDRRAILWNQP